MNARQGQTGGQQRKLRMLAPNKLLGPQPQSFFTKDQESRSRDRTELMRLLYLVIVMAMGPRGSSSPYRKYNISLCRKWMNLEMRWLSTCHVVTLPIIPDDAKITTTITIRIIWKNKNNSCHLQYHYKQTSLSNPSIIFRRDDTKQRDETSRCHYQSVRVLKQYACLTRVYTTTYPHRHDQQT